MKKISIITAVKNGMPHIKEALNSFNLQNYENFKMSELFCFSQNEKSKISKC